MDASAEITAVILEWYDSHARALPWRALPGAPSPDPYRVWLSEVMLQQTTVAAVIPYFEMFSRRWPSVAALAEAEDADVMAAWAGLGYYARARNLLACARAVAAAGGDFPCTEAGLRALPGLGAYTAAAVAAIAFGERAVVVDANVERVAARLFAISDPLPAARAVIRNAVDGLTPAERPGDFAQAMMDLGATVCTSRAPRCLLCPLRPACRAHASGRVTDFPVKPARMAKPQRLGTALWIKRDDAVLLVTRPGKGMLGGMRALPDDGWNARGNGAGAPPGARLLGVVPHVFTHFTLHLQVMDCSALPWPDSEMPQGEWWPVRRLDDAGLPTLFARAAQLALAGGDEGEV